MNNAIQQPDYEDRDRLFEQEFKKHLNALYRYAMQLTNDPNERDDLIQEVCKKALENIDKYEPGTNARAWLFRICYNAFINRLRAQKRNLSKPGNEQDLLRASGKPEMTYDPENMPIGDEVTAALQSLTLENRTIFMLALERFSYQEISVVLGMNLNTVRTRLRRTRDTLSRQLEDYGRQNGYRSGKHPDTDV